MVKAIMMLMTSVKMTMIVVIMMTTTMTTTTMMMTTMQPYTYVIASHELLNSVHLIVKITAYL